MHPFARWHRNYLALKIGAAALVHVLGGVLHWIGAGLTLIWGLTVAFFMPEFGWLAVIVTIAIAIQLATRAAELFFMNLPGITPRHINNAPGRSRLADRDELRRSRVI